MKWRASWKSSCRVEAPATPLLRITAKIASTVDEFYHDGRHFLAFPCH